MEKLSPLVRSIGESITTQPNGNPMGIKETDLLIVGGESDPNTQRIVDQAHLRNLDYYYWDTDLPHARQIAWDFQECMIDLAEHSVRPKGVYLRYNVFAGDPQQNHAIFETVEAFAMAWPNLHLLNRKTAGDANNKSRNLVWAKHCGLVIPETLVLSDLTPLESMPDADQRIIKPLSGGDHACVVNEVNQDIEHLTSLSPQFVQEKIDGENLRVFSIAGQLFAFHLQTSEVDYRTDQHVVVRQMDVPEELIEATNRLVNEMGFDYCALDFRFRSGFESPVFLEINSFPMFVAFDDACENRLADAILEFLT